MSRPDPRVARRSPSVDEDGFTMVELLIVLVVMPLIIGAIAATLITLVNDSAQPSNRISDSANAQTTGSYFLRDVQGAAKVTTYQTLFTSGTYSANSPQVCGPSAFPAQAASLPAPKLLVALYRPAFDNSTPKSTATTSSPALDVAYWLQVDPEELTMSNPSEAVIRYACTVSANTGVSTLATTVRVASPPAGAFTGTPITSISSSVPDILPAQFATAAAGGWTNLSSFTVTNSATSLSSTSPVTIQLVADSGFSITGTFVVTVSTTSGNQTVSCTGTSTYTVNAVTFPEFTGCLLTGGAATATAPLGAYVTQASVSGIQVTVKESASNYQFNLLGSPLGGTGTQGNLPSTGPTLLLYGNSGITLNGVGSNNCGLDPTAHNKDKVCINGNVVVNGGVISCGTGSIYASAGIEAAGGATCSGQTIPPTNPISDPEYGVLPNCFQSFVTLPTYTTLSQGSDGAGNLKPGIYQTALSGSLDPGVFVIEGGVGNVTMASESVANQTYFEEGSTTPDLTSGVLLYFPAAAGSYPGTTCLTAPTATTYSLNNSSIKVAPMDATQGYYYFHDSGVSDIWAWQDVLNTTNISYSGNSNVCSGDAYAGVDPNFTTQCGNNSGSATGSVIYGLGYFRSASLSFTGNPGFFMGKLEISGYVPGSGTPFINLTGS